MNEELKPIDPLMDFQNKIDNKLAKINRQQRRQRRQKTSSLSYVFEEVKARFKEKNISLDEIAKNCNVSRELVEVIFSENIVDDISRIIQFAKVKITVSNNWDMKVYRVNEDSQSIKVTRLIKPLCHIYYDKESGNFYNFHMHKDSPNKSLYIKEMAQVVKDRLEKNQ